MPEQGNSFMTTCSNGVVSRLGRLNFWRMTAAAGAAGPLRRTTVRVRRFVGETLWRTELAHLTRAKAAAYAGARVAIAAIRSFHREVRSGQAAALTYYTLLALV